VPTPLLTTKLFSPPIRLNTLPRPRLIQSLEAGIDGKLTLVSAPPGFGKTTLITAWLHSTDRPFTWLSLDEGDNDPVRFLTYLVTALQTIDKSIGLSTPTFFSTPQLPGVDLPLTTLINEITVVPESFVLVLDDYQVIHTQWIHSAVDFMVEHQPPNVHLVLITRKDPPISLSRLRVRAEVTELRAEDLRFTIEEAATFLNHTLDLNLTVETVSALESRTEGWIAGLQMAALAMKGSLSTPDSAKTPSLEGIKDFIEAFRGSHRFVIDYLVDEVLTQQPAEIRAFLSQTAILDRFTAPLCDAVASLEDLTHMDFDSRSFSHLEPYPLDSSKNIIEYLERENLFVIPLDSERKWYRYHQLFSDFLRTELTEEKKTELHLIAARWFETNGMLPEAVKHALASELQNDVEAAAEVYRQGALFERQKGNQLGAMVAHVNLVLVLNEMGDRHQALAVERDGR